MVQAKFQKRQATVKGTTGNIATESEIQNEIKVPGQTLTGITA